MGEGGALVVWDWWTVEFGDAHAGAAGALVGGSEPAPVYFDVGSGPDIRARVRLSHRRLFAGRSV
ncbi:hypothetical protein ACFY04_42100 [Streptomyces sp. NPDC001549]|uniref:hypothetical protein n=1 Tax=Streptomyces sp. NPDC001549 TaxID=3364586 RepID=UPI0036AA814F